MPDLAILRLHVYSDLYIRRSPQLPCWRVSAGSSGCIHNPIHNLERTHTVHHILAPGCSSSHHSITLGRSVLGQQPSVLFLVSHHNGIAMQICTTHATCACKTRSATAATAPKSKSTPVERDTRAQNNLRAAVGNMTSAPVANNTSSPSSNQEGCHIWLLARAKDAPTSNPQPSDMKDLEAMMDKDVHRAPKGERWALKQN